MRISACVVALGPRSPASRLPGPRRSPSGWRGNRQGPHEPALAIGGPSFRTISSGIRPMLCHCAMRRTETPVPAMHGRPPRMSGRREIKLPSSVTVAIDFKHNALGLSRWRVHTFPRFAQRPRARSRKDGSWLGPVPATILSKPGMKPVLR
jgi:hypothetical protein